MKIKKERILGFICLHLPTGICFGKPTAPNEMIDMVGFRGELIPFKTKKELKQFTGKLGKDFYICQII